MSFAYLHARPDTSSASGIFYVGKGNRTRRARDFGGRNKYHASVVAKYGSGNILIGTIECSTEPIAFDLETGLIKCLTRMGVKLCNMSTGGEGSSGVPASAAQRLKMKEVNAGLDHAKRSAARKKEPEDTDMRRSETMKTRWESTSSEEKQRRAEQASALNLVSWADPEVRARRIAGMRGKKKTMTAAALEARKLNASKRKSKGKLA